ncbi:MAG: nickel-dependent hydrogenase large subunit [Candidatus Thiodiazotropha sp. (ex Monitilora ramsayi)]|nr:nickel-dependent hydrogenase large subunit [Candidatus Thiodiazotropha sp. (ex Monitilora ramsayi)]
MSVEGELHINLMCRDRHVEQVNIRSSRPMQLPLIFKGKPMDDVLQMIPMLYSVCANAQAQAAVTACRQAVDQVADPSVAAAESMLVWCETGREHLWRILIDWPAFAGETVDRTQLKDLPELMKRAKSACFGNQSKAFSLQPELQFDPERFQQVIDYLSTTSERAVFGLPPEHWYDMADSDDFHRWVDKKATAPARLLSMIKAEEIGQLGDVPVCALPPFDCDEIDQRLQAPDADRFVSAPDWDEIPCESTTLTRQSAHPLINALQRDYGNGLMTRMVARLLELAEIPRLLSRKLQSLLNGNVPKIELAHGSRGVGVGIVEAARGRLTHRVLLEGDLINRYQILAPTEWNFHPAGIVAQALTGLPAGDEDQLRRQASLFINAVDPCVGYRLEVT